MAILNTMDSLNTKLVPYGIKSEFLVLKKIHLNSDASFNAMVADSIHYAIWHYLWVFRVYGFVKSCLFLGTMAIILMANIYTKNRSRLYSTDALGPKLEQHTQIT